MAKVNPLNLKFNLSYIEFWINLKSQNIFGIGNGSFFKMFLQMNEDLRSASNFYDKLIFGF